MQVPSVSGIFQARVSGLGFKAAFAPRDASGEFASALMQAMGVQGQGDSASQADYNLQQLTILPGPGDAQASAGDQTSAGVQADAVQPALGSGTYQATAALYSTRSSSGTMPLYIPKGSYLAASAAPALYAAPDANPGLAGQIVSYAEQFVGTPYAWGGEDLVKGTDCSGLTQSVFKHFGISLPRSSYRQSMVGTAVDPDQLQPGDLLFFKYSDRAPVTHVAMYVGDGKVIEAATRGVQIRTLRGNWTKHLVVAKRVIQ